MHMRIPEWYRRLEGSAPKVKARMYFGVASNHDASQPDAKDTVAARLVRAGYADTEWRADLQQGGWEARLEQTAGFV